MSDAIHAYRIVRGGPVSVRRFQEVFGFTAEVLATGTYRVAAVSWVHGALQVEVARRGYGVTPIWLVPAARDKGYVRAGDMGLSYEDSARQITPWLERLLRHLTVRLSRARLAVLRDIVLNDPEAEEYFGGQEAGSEQRPLEQHDEDDGRDGAAAGRGPAEDDAGEREPRDGPWDSRARHGSRLPGAWADFFSETASQRNAVCSLHFTAPTFHITHGDLECLFTSPGYPTRLVHFYNYPWSPTRPVARLLGRRLGEEEQFFHSHRQLVTDIDDLEVITGSTEKLERLIDLALERRTNQILRVNCTCVPMVTGDDVEAATRRATEDADVPVIYTDQLSHEPFGVVGELLLAEREALRRHGDPTGRYNLVGFPDTPATAELVALLERAGAVLNQVLVPELDVPSYREILEAEANVFLPNLRQREVYQLGFASLPSEMGQVAPDAPYGWGGTARWAAAVGGALSLGGAAAEACAATESRLRPRWEQLAALAGSHRLAFVVDRRHVALLLDPTRLFGLPLLAMIAEMGFGVDVLVHAPDDDLDYARGLAAASGGADLALRPFGSRDTLIVRLRESPARAVYSDFFYDHRLTTSGKAQFSAPDFEMGYEGALRSLERLVGLCELPFYHRYHHYLRRARTAP